MHVPTATPQGSRPILGAAVGLAGVVVLNACFIAFDPHITRAVPLLLLLIPVTVASLIGGWKASVPLAVVTACVYSFHFVAPIGVVSLGYTEDTLTMVTFVLVAVILSALGSRRDARRAEREHQRAVLLRSVSHDLRNPLGTIRAASAELRGDAIKDEATRNQLLDLVVDESERLDRIADYLDAVEGRVQRQVELDARIVEIELKDATATGVDWRVIAAGMTAASSTPAAAPARRSLTGLRVTDLPRFMSLLGEQGTVNAIQNNRVVALNNEPAIVRSETLTLSVTPQIASDGVVMLSLTPMLTTPAIAESDTLARVADGETLVISGFTRSREVRERTNQGLRGGWFGRRTVVTQKRVEILILLTPKIL